jgi:hypothetical protein
MAECGWARQGALALFVLSAALSPLGAVDTTAFAPMSKSLADDAKQVHYPPVFTRLYILRPLACPVR